MEDIHTTTDRRKGDATRDALDAPRIPLHAIMGDPRRPRGFMQTLPSRDERLVRLYQRPRIPTTDIKDAWRAVITHRNAMEADPARLMWPSWEQLPLSPPPRGDPPTIRPGDRR